MDRPGVGVGVYIRKGGKILLGLRKGGTGAGMWCPPGGKLGMYEEWEDCARRETLEEVGIEIEGARLMTVTNDPSRDVGTHYITLHFSAEPKSGTARLMEPDKFEKWEWFEWGKLPEPLFWPIRNFVKTGYNPFTI